MGQTYLQLKNENATMNTTHEYGKVSKEQAHQPLH